MVASIEDVVKRDIVESRMHPLVGIFSRVIELQGDFA